jgi:hypothetical protein
MVLVPAKYVTFNLDLLGFMPFSSVTGKLLFSTIVYSEELAATMQASF